LASVVDYLFHLKLSQTNDELWSYAIRLYQTSENLADPFTKGLSRNVIDNASKKIGMRPTI
jgi:hypothetical protein